MHSSEARWRAGISVRDGWKCCIADLGWRGCDSRTLGVADSFLIPAGVPHSLGEFGDGGFEMVEVMLPAVVNFEAIE